MSGYFKQQNGYLGEQPSEPTYQVMYFDGHAHVVRRVVVHRFSVGDVEDPDLYAGQPLWEWQNSESGKWIMEHAIETPSWHRNNNIASYTIEYCIIAKLKDVDYTFWTLKWGMK